MLLSQTDGPLISFDVMVHSIEFGIVLPVVGYLMRTAWADMKELIFNIRSDVNELAKDFDDFRVDMTDRVARIEEHQSKR